MSGLNTSQMANKAWIGSILITAFTYGSYLTLSNYMIPFSERSGASIGQIALLFTFAGFSTMVISIFLGKLLKVLKVRTLVPIGAVCLSSIYLALAFSNSLIILYIAAVFYGAAVVVTGFGVSQTQVIWWFEPKQIGRRLTAITAGLAIMTFIQSPIVAKSIIEIGLEKTALLHALISALAIILASRLLLLEKPESYGIKIGKNTEEESINEKSKVVSKEKVLPMVIVLSTIPFWLITIASMVESLTFTGYANNASPFYQSFGLDPVQAAFCISIVSGGQAIMAPLFGYFVDKLGLAKSVAIFGMIVSITFLCARFINSYQTAIVFAVFASAFAFISFIAPVGFRIMYPDADVGTLIGFANAASQVGTMAGAPVAGFIFATTGSYIPFMTLSSLLLVVCIIFVFVATGKRAQKNIDNATVTLVHANNSAKL